MRTIVPMGSGSSMVFIELAVGFIELSVGFIELSVVSLLLTRADNKRRWC